jgi:anti-sigma factor RsiW
MNQTTHVDIKAYAVGEMSEADKRQAAAHVAGCEACSEELAGVQATLGSLAMLRDEDAPRRIAFVSDKVFEPSWWQRLNPMFASACLIAAAIVAHGFVSQPAVDAATQAVIQQAVDNEMQDLMVHVDQQEKTMRQFVKASMNQVTY